MICCSENACFRSNNFCVGICFYEPAQKKRSQLIIFYIKSNAYLFRGIRLLTNLNTLILQGEDRQKSKASAPGMARLEPPAKGLRHLYDPPVFTVNSRTIDNAVSRGFTAPKSTSVA